MFQTKVVEKIKTHILYSKLMWKNTAGPEIPQMAMLHGAEKMRFECRIPKAKTQTRLIIFNVHR
jgi:hypothetical protein